MDASVDIKSILGRILDPMVRDAGTEAVISEAAECAYMFPANSNEAAMGQSRLGGWPDLPPSVSWPEGVGTGDGYAAYLAQFRLSEIPAMQGSLLPGTGMLWIFCKKDASDQWDEPPQMELIYSPDPGSLERRTLPSRQGPDSARSVPVRFERGWSLPLGRVPHVRGWGSDVQVAMFPVDRLHNATIPHERLGQVGGYALHVSETPRDLYRRVALTRFGHREMADADEWDTLEAYETNLMHFRSRSPRNHEYVQDLEALRPQVQWIVAHSKEIEAEASSWRLLFDLRGSVRGLDLGSFENLFIFAREPERPLSDFRQLELAAEYESH